MHTATSKYVLSPTGLSATSQYVLVNGRTRAVVVDNGDGTHTACANPNANTAKWDRTSTDKNEAIAAALAACGS
jgi:hypothetical protein